MLEAVDRFPLSPGEMMQDRVGKWYVRCPNCGAVSNGKGIDKWWECPECGTIVDPSMKLENDGTSSKGLWRRSHEV